LHPILEAALIGDIKSLARYLLISGQGSEYRALLNFKSLLGLAFSTIAELPASGYEPVLISKGCDPVLARGLGNLALRMGNQMAEVAKCRRDVVSAIRFFSKSSSAGKVAIKKAVFLLHASQTCSAVETLFYEQGMSADEFLYLLNLFRRGQGVNHQRLTEIAKEISPSLTIPRGRKPSAASVAHEFLLQQINSGYSWSPSNEDFSDSLTQATRAEFGDQDFNPAPARRRINARQTRAI
jgi:hypothetical protein